MCFTFILPIQSTFSTPVRKEQHPINSTDYQIKPMNDIFYCILQLNDRTNCNSTHRLWFKFHTFVKWFEPSSTPYNPVDSLEYLDEFPIMGRSYRLSLGSVSILLCVFITIAVVPSHKPTKWKVFKIMPNDLLLPGRQAHASLETREPRWANVIIIKLEARFGSAANNLTLLWTWLRFTLPLLKRRTSSPSFHSNQIMRVRVCS